MRQLFFFFTAAALLSGSGSVFGESCNLPSLQGRYAGTVSGHNLSDVPVAYQAIAHFDGSGGFSLSGFTYVSNGTVIVSDATASGGTYTVSRDCSGSIQITSNGQNIQVRDSDHRSGSVPVSDARNRRQRDNNGQRRETGGSQKAPISSTKMLWLAKPSTRMNSRLSSSRTKSRRSPKPGEPT